MKLFFYCMREFDELPIARECAEKYGIEFAYTTQYPSQENAGLAAGYEAVSFTPCDMGTAMVETFAALGVKYLLCHSIGYNHVDISRARELGMHVCNVDYPPIGVADHTILLMLMCIRKIGHQLQRCQVQDYTLRGKLGKELHQCTVGILGTGSIGACVIRQLQGFGCRILAYSPHPKKELAEMCTFVDLDTLLRESDILSLHALVSPETTHILNADTLSRCKPGVTIINTARGMLIDTDALIAALESGQVGAAGLDVLENENGLYYYDRMGQVIPNRQLAILRSMPNVVLTPHTAFYTETNVRGMVEGNFRSYALLSSGQPDPHELT